jgi:antitoxin MazE
LKANNGSLLAVNATIQKWGNSLALRIPDAVARDAHLCNGLAVSVVVEQGRVVIEPAKKTKFRLDDLLKRVSKRNMHASVATGPAVGREVW